MEVLKQIFDMMLGALTTNTAITAISIMALLLLYLGWAMAGYKAMRAFSTLFGAVLGVAGGYTAVHLIHVNEYLTVLIPIIAAIVLAAVGFFLYRVGLFFVAVSMVVSVVYPILEKYVALDRTILVILSLAAGLILGILCMVFFRPMVIITSALFGGVGFSITLFSRLVHIRWNEQASLIAVAIVALVVTVFGLIYQFRNSN